MVERRTSAGRRPRREAEASKRRIIATARTLFSRHGFDAVGIREIAMRAGTTHGLVRHHFGSKFAVWQAVVEATEREYVSAVAPLLDGLEEGQDPVERAAEFVRGFVAVSARHPDAMRLLMHEGVSSGPRLALVLEYLGVAHRRLEPLLDELQARGLLLTWSSATLFHFLLFSASAPFALPALSRGLIGRRASVTDHAERLVATLLGPTAAPQRR